MKNKFTNYEEYIELQKSKVKDKSHLIRGGPDLEYKKQIKFKRPWVNLVKQYAPKPTNKILVLGGRWGSDIRYLREAGFECEIIAIDLYNPPLISTVQYGDAHDLSAFKGPFDIVWVYHVFEHFYSPSTVIKQIESVVKQSSILAIVLPSYTKKDRYDAQTEFTNEGEFLHLFDNSIIKLEHREVKKKKDIKKREPPDYWYIFKVY